MVVSMTTLLDGGEAKEKEMKTRRVHGKIE
jgi:hypothetical protein